MIKPKHTDIELFKMLYYNSDDFSFSNDNSINDFIISLGYTEQKAEYIKSKFCLKRGCRHCGKDVDEVDFSIVGSYWNNGMFGSKIFVCHSYCLKDQINSESYDCQNIDRDCNDCKFFKRGKRAEAITQKHKDIIVSVDLKTPLIYKIGTVVNFHGKCEKHSIGTFAYPQFASGYSCFEHRKS